MYDAPGSDSKAEWVELQNIGTNSVDISKWKFNDGSNHVLNAPPKNGSTGSLDLQPGEYLILTSNAVTFLSSHSVSVSVIDTVIDLPNDSGKISLLDASSSVVNKVSYSSSHGGNGTGESLQSVNGKLVPGKPTPGEPNASVRLPKPPVQSSSKTTTKKVATNFKPEILDGTSTVAADVADSAETSSPMLAAAVVPLSTGSSGYLPWVYGVLALGIAGASAIFVARQKKKEEWDIEEIT
jgi:hypothetical protein